MRRIAHSLILFAVACGPGTAPSVKGIEIKATGISFAPVITDASRLGW